MLRFSRGGVLAGSIVLAQTDEEVQVAAELIDFAMAPMTFGPGACGAVSYGNGTMSCSGAYTALAKITNSETGTIWFTPSTGTTNGIATDSSGLSAPYNSVVVAMRRRDLFSWCGTNTVSFPAQSTNQYKFFICVKNTLPPPTNGQVLTLDVQWQP